MATFFYRTANPNPNPNPNPYLTLTLAKWAIIELYHGEMLHGARLEVSLLAVTSPMYLKNNK